MELELIYKATGLHNLRSELNATIPRLKRADAEIEKMRERLAKVEKVVSLLLQHESTVFCGKNAEKDRSASWRGLIRAAKKSLPRQESV